MTTLTLKQAYDACETNKTAWLHYKAALAAAEQEYREQTTAGTDHPDGRLQALREITDIKK